MQHILSIQSHVAYGYVGNRAAVFPLQRLGFDVTAINTVQFSNHTGYGDWEGEIFSPAQVQKLVEGIKRRGVFERFDAVLSGYMGDAALGALIVEIVTELKQHNENLIYCCDPVIGDVGRGVFVRDGVGAYFKQHAVHVADILTPNHFELNYLTDMPVDSLEQTLAACQALTEQGPQTILVTSLIHDQTPEDTIEMLAFEKDQAFLIQTPRFDLNPAPNGAGDVTAALFLAQRLKQTPLNQALESVAASLHALFEATHRAGSRELQLIDSQAAWAAPERRFKARQIS